MNLHFPKIPILISTALALAGCSDQSITATQKEEYRNSKPLLEWIRGAEFGRGGQEIRVPVKKIGQATAEQRGLVETAGGGARMQLSPERKPLAVQGGGSSPSLEFSIVEAFSEVSKLINNAVTNLGASSTESTGFKFAGYGLSFSRTSNKETSASQTVSESTSQTATLSGPDGASLKYVDNFRYNAKGTWDGHPVREWSLSKSGDLDFKTFLSDVLAGTGSGSPRYSLEIFEDPENQSFWVLVTVRFPIDETIRAISK
jgi:hypothetical protein